MSKHSDLCVCGNRPSPDDGAELLPPDVEGATPARCGICGCDRTARVTVPHGGIPPIVRRLPLCLPCYGRGWAVEALRELGINGIRGVALDTPPDPDPALDAKEEGPRCVPGCVLAPGHEGMHYVGDPPRAPADFDLEDVPRVVLPFPDKS